MGGGADMGGLISYGACNGGGADMGGLISYGACNGGPGIVRNVPNLLKILCVLSWGREGGGV